MLFPVCGFCQIILWFPLLHFALPPVLFLISSTYFVSFGEDFDISGIFTRCGILRIVPIYLLFQTSLTNNHSMKRDPEGGSIKERGAGGAVAKKPNYLYFMHFFKISQPNSFVWFVFHNIKIAWTWVFPGGRTVPFLKPHKCIKWVGTKMLTHRPSCNHNCLWGIAQLSSFPAELGQKNHLCLNRWFEPWLKPCQTPWSFLFPPFFCLCNWSFLSTILSPN